MIDLGRVSMARFNARYLSASLPALIAAYIASFWLYSSSVFFTGAAVVMFLDFLIMETRMLIIQNPFSWPAIDALGAKKAHVQLAIIAMRFFFYAVLLLFAAGLNYPDGFFFGFFIAYFTDISILVLASYRKLDK